MAPNGMAPERTNCSTRWLQETTLYRRIETLAAENEKLRDALFDVWYESNEATDVREFLAKMQELGIEW